jgi:hypothetical protein
VWAGVPVIVVEDGPEQLVLYLPEGAPFGFADGRWPGGRHPWFGRPAWQGHGVLMLHRPGDAYSVWIFWEGPDRRLSRWYVNLQAPFSRTALGVDTLDHELDVWSADGRTWHLKDEELLDQRVAEGRYSAEEAASIRELGQRLRTELPDDARWWDEGWAAWKPDPRWPVPALPPGWDRERGCDG